MNEPRISEAKARKRLAAIESDIADLNGQLSELGAQTSKLQAQRDSLYDSVEISEDEFLKQYDAISEELAEIAKEAEKLEAQRQVIDHRRVPIGRAVDYFDRLLAVEKWNQDQAVIKALSVRYNGMTDEVNSILSEIRELVKHPEIRESWRHEPNPAGGSVQLTDVQTRLLNLNQIPKSLEPIPVE